MKNKLLILTMGIFLISFASAVGDIGIVKQGDCIDLYNYCPTCSYINLTAIQNPNGTLETMNLAMEKNGNNYIYNYCNTTQLGEYSYTTCGDKGGTETCEDITFEITPSGSSGITNIAFFVLIIVLLYTLNIIAFRDENAPLTILSGMALIALGIYLVNNGIIIYRDNITNYIGYITIAWGFISTMFAVWNEYLQNF